MTETFALLESLRFEPRTGYVLLPTHLDRLERTASHFGFRCPRDEVQAALTRQAAQLLVPAKVRLLVDADGRISTEAAAIESGAPVRVALARAPIDPGDPFLYHKTTRRLVYEQALQGRGDADDVLLWNPSGGVTEASSSNLVVRLDSDLVTPPVSEGLLAGTFRDALVSAGVVRERAVSVADLARATALYLINSVRGWRRATYIPQEIK